MSSRRGREYSSRGGGGFRVFPGGGGREKVLKWHCDLLVDMFQVSQVWSKSDVQAALDSFNGENEQVCTKQNGEDWLMAQAYH